MSDYKQLQYAFTRRKRNLDRISQELIWAGDHRTLSHDTVLDIAIAVQENKKAEEELLARFIF